MNCAIECNTFGWFARQNIIIIAVKMGWNSWANHGFGLDWVNFCFTNFNTDWFFIRLI